MTSPILLVDDDPFFVKLLAHSFQQQGVEVKPFYDYEAALESYKQNRFPRALLDLNIDGKSGIKLMQAILEINPNCHIVILTGYASVANAVDAIKLGAANYLCKPAKIEDILKAFHPETDVELTQAEEEMTPMSVKRMEWEHIQRVLQEHNGNITATAKALNMHRRTLQRKLQKRPVQQ